jgi:hypothetical protein
MPSLHKWYHQKKNMCKIIHPITLIFAVHIYTVVGNSGAGGEGGDLEQSILKGGTWGCQKIGRGASLSCTDAHRGEGHLMYIPPKRLQKFKNAIKHENRGPPFFSHNPKSPSKGFENDCASMLSCFITFFDQIFQTLPPPCVHCASLFLHRLLFRSLITFYRRKIRQASKSKTLTHTIDHLFISVNFSSIKKSHYLNYKNIVFMRVFFYILS